MEYSKVDALSLANGAVKELLDDSLSKVINNIKDLNTSPIKVREVVLKIKIKPSEDRENCVYGIFCEEKLAPVKEVTNVAILAEEKNGKFSIYEAKNNDNEIINNDKQIGRIG